MRWNFVSERESQGWVALTSVDVLVASHLWRGSVLQRPVCLLHQARAVAANRSLEKRLQALHVDTSQGNG